MSMCFLTFAMFISAIRIGHRTLIELHSENLITNKQLPKIGTVILLIFVTGIFVFSRTPIMIWLLSTLLLGVLFSARMWLGIWRKNRFHKSFPGFLDQIILRMSTGRGFMQSARISISLQPQQVQGQWCQLLDRIAFVPAGRPDEWDHSLQEIERLFRFVEKNRHQALSVLREYRGQLRIREYFRHKSRQLTRQSRMQAAIMSVLYIIMAVVTLYLFGLRQHIAHFGLSLILFLFGTLMMMRTGKRIQWKV